MDDYTECYMCHKKMKRNALYYKKFQLKSLTTHAVKTLSEGYVCSQECYLMFLATNYWLVHRDRERVIRALVENHGIGWVWADKAVFSIQKQLAGLQEELMEEKAHLTDH